MKHGEVFEKVVQMRNSLDRSWDILSRVPHTPANQQIKDQVTFAIATLEALLEELEDGD
jgi:hypothetical protein